MKERLSNGCTFAFQLAAKEAQNLGSRLILPEHVLLGLLKVNDFCELTANIAGFDQVDQDDLRDEIEVINAAMRYCSFSPVKARRKLRRILAYGDRDAGAFSGHRSSRCQHVFRVAWEIAQEYCWHEIRVHHLLDAVLLQESDVMDDLFSAMGVDRENLMIMKRPSYRQSPYHEPAFREADDDVVDEDFINDLLKHDPGQPAAVEDSHPATPFLDANARDITRLARHGKLPPVIGRLREIQQLSRVLAQRVKKNALLVGAPGVGKTCLVEGLAQLIVSPEAPALLKRLRIVEITMGSLVAGTKYRGEFEEKVSRILQEAASDPNLVLFIDEMHTLVNAGAAEGALSAGNMMKPALSRGEITCIGATTIGEYRRYMEKDPALQRRFQVVHVEEPTPEECVAILQGLAPQFQDHFGLKLPDAVIQRTVEWAVRYLPELRLPDKAIDLIDQACAAATIGTPGPDSCKVPGELDCQMVARVLSERCQIPLEDLTEEESQRLLRLEEHLRRRVKGQDAALQVISEAIRAARVGLKNPQRPVCFFLAGGTGVGKTETARALAEILFRDERRLLRFDMSEYQEKHSVSRLIGAPPGYVGHEEDGELTGKIRTTPHAVVLLDELEKAHPDVCDIFLQMLDSGRLTDGRGRQVNFSECIVVFTSNLGASSLAAAGHFHQGIGFMATDGRREDVKGYQAQVCQSIQAHFRPEFINRLGNIVVFRPLGREAVDQILDKIVDEANSRLAARDIRLTLDAAAREFLMTKGYSEQYGARELERCFSRYVNEPLARLILNGDIQPLRQVLKLGSDGEKIVIAPAAAG